MKNSWLRNLALLRKGRTLKDPKAAEEQEREDRLAELEEELRRELESRQGKGS